MSTIAIIGAGPGLGQATARRFGREGFSVALISRAQAHVDELARQLTGDGITARGYAADVRDPQRLRAALDAAAAAGAAGLAGREHQRHALPIFATGLRHQGQAL